MKGFANNSLTAVIVALVILLLSLVVLLPRVRDIHKENNAVLSLLMLIPAGELQKTVGILEDFLSVFIDKQTEEVEKENKEGRREREEREKD